VLGIRDWQWLYVIESIPAIALGFGVLWLLADRPAKAAWLTADERAWLSAEFSREAPAPAERHHGFSWDILIDPRVLTLALVFFLTGMPSYGLSLWMPQIVKSFGVSTFVTGILTAIPFLFGCIAMVAWGQRSDARGERLWHAASSAIVGGIGLVAGAVLTSAPLQLIAVCVAAAGIYGLKGPFLTIVSESFADSRAAAGIALVASLGNLSGFFAPYLVGVVIESAGSYRPALAGLGLQCVLGAVVLVWWLKGRDRRLRDSRRSDR